jgi:hypothetical protein
MRRIGRLEQAAAHTAEVMAIALQSSEFDRESLRHGFHIGESLAPSRALRTKRKWGAQHAVGGGG